MVFSSRFALPMSQWQPCLRALRVTAQSPPDRTIRVRVVVPICRGFISVLRCSPLRPLLALWQFFAWGWRRRRHRPRLSDLSSPVAVPPSALAPLIPAEKGRRVAPASLPGRLGRRASSAPSYTASGGRPGPRSDPLPYRAPCFVRTLPRGLPSSLLTLPR